MRNIFLRQEIIPAKVDRAKFSINFKDLQEFEPSIWLHVIPTYIKVSEMVARFNEHAKLVHGPIAELDIHKGQRAQV